jgi:ankyrin repeat protein
MERLWPIMTPDGIGEAMMIAITNDRLDDVRGLITQGGTGSMPASSVARGPGEITLFHFACERLNLEAARLLYSPSIDLEAVDSNGMTALMSVFSAISPEHEPGTKNKNWCEPERLEKAEMMARWLVGLGANVNAIRAADVTVLHWAVQGGSQVIIELLVDHGARVDWPPEDSLSALVLAARNNNVGALKALVESGADIHRPCGLGWTGGRTALGVAMMEHAQGYEKPDAIAYLKSVGAEEWPHGHKPQK